jgi:hypothetical protein
VPNKVKEGQARNQSNIGRIRRLRNIPQSPNPVRTAADDEKQQLKQGKSSSGALLLLSDASTCHKGRLS